MRMLGRRPRSSDAVTASKQRMMMDEINRAQQLASQMQALLPQLLPHGSSLSELAAYEMEQMIMCYSSVLSNRKPLAASPAGTSRRQPPLNTPKVKPAGDHCFPRELKIRDKSHLMKEQRDHYWPNDHKKRRKIEDSISVVTAIPYGEQHWRKYGQKSIRGAKQPRSYFKCSYWKEQGCQAKKTIQQDDKDEAKYHVVYIKRHTCSVAHHIFPNYLLIESPPEILSSNYSGKCARSSFVDILGQHQICPPYGRCFGSSSVDIPVENQICLLYGKCIGSSSVDIPVEHQICPLHGKCIGSSSVDIPVEHQICPPPADQPTTATGDEELMQNNIMPSSEVASPVPTPGTLEMINNDEMLGFLPVLESVELDDDSLMTMIDELCGSEIYI